MHLNESDPSFEYRVYKALRPVHTAATELK